MPPNKIIDSSFIIPVNSHSQAKSIVSQHEKTTILYWIPLQDAGDTTYPIYLYEKNTQSNNNLIVDGQEDDKINYLLNEQRFSYKQEAFEELTQLLERFNIDAVTQQEVVTYFLNNTYLALPEDREISSKQKWTCDVVPNYHIIGINTYHNDHNEEKKVYFGYVTEGEKNSVISYIVHLEKIISNEMNKNCKLDYTIASEQVVFENCTFYNFFIVLTPEALKIILEYQKKVTAIPTLTELTYRRLAKIADPLLIKQNNKNIFGLNISIGIKNRLENKKDDNEIKSTVEYNFNTRAINDPRFSFFNYPHLKTMAVDNVTNTVKYLVEEEKPKKNCNIM